MWFVKKKFIFRGIDKPNVRFVIHHTMSKSMENYYQESGRAGRDGKRAECILMYRSADISRITTMVFTEHTGLENAYKMIEFCIEGISCRRDLISKHFMDVWSDKAECNKMCDRCNHRNGVNPPKMNIVEYCLALYKIIDCAANLDVKLTMLKLVDSWYQKGKPNLRCKDIPVPSFERYYAEQIVAFLLIKGYLKEDFHFTAYNTISYINKSGRIVNEGDRIIFYGARVLLLPEQSKIKKEISTPTKTSTKNSEDCVYVTDTDAPPAKKIKKEKKSRSNENTSQSEHELSSMTDSDVPLAKRVKKEKKHKSNGKSSHSEMDLNVSTTSSKHESSPKKKKKSKHNKKGPSEEPDEPSPDQDDECVILVEGSDVIEID